VCVCRCMCVRVCTFYEVGSLTDVQADVITNANELFGNEILRARVNAFVVGRVVCLSVCVFVCKCVVVWSCTQVCGATQVGQFYYYYKYEFTSRHVVVTRFSWTRETSFKWSVLAGHLHLTDLSSLPQIGPLATVYVHSLSLTSIRKSPMCP